VKGRKIRRERGAGFAREETNAERRRGGNRGERNDALRAGGTEVCAKRGAHDGGGDVQLAYPVGRLAKIVICAGGGPEVLTGSTRLKAEVAEEWC